MHYQTLQSKFFIDLNAILPLIKHWTNLQETIVFTNGCFDILHRGHIDYLYRAADLGTKLVVGLNSDSSVRMLKGNHRPIQNQIDRLHILAALSCVSAVVVFDEPTPRRLIEGISPNVLVKGSDYDVADIVGANWVVESGGTVQTIDYLVGCSTSAIEQKIIDMHQKNLNISKKP